MKMKNKLRHKADQNIIKSNYSTVLPTFWGNILHARYISSKTVQLKTFISFNEKKKGKKKIIRFYTQVQ